MSLRMKCQRCQGDGTIRRTINDGWLRIGGKVRCPACRGTGKVAVR